MLADYRYDEYVAKLVAVQTRQRILRHSNVSVTKACYIKTANQDSVRALESLDAVLCPTCALESAKPQTLQLQ